MYTSISNWAYIEYFSTLQKTHQSIALENHNHRKVSYFITNLSFIKSLIAESSLKAFSNFYHLLKSR
jgi:hypothetical protein